MTVKVVMGKASTTIRRVSKVFVNRHGILSIKQGKNSIKLTSDNYDWVSVVRF